ncbi:hypothetical protein FB561_7439 [Kribbella amoyensis]|uniref:Uncharacterized protein n=1 Tax=Kribbella amoyensis TaxID=996641 RepID=A0A561B0R6_9ACTN|nr:hypothetical protein [Kribbella amoyensis]TWD72447.1 hypothetical protein FB561_7439 [Kribbella amoyensis]
MDIARFSSAFSDARHRQRTEQDFDTEAAQTQLRDLLTGEPDDEDRAWAYRMIEKLAEPLQAPPERSPLYEEAGRIHAAAYPIEGTVEEQIEALVQARRQIWQLADRASEEEAPSIRGMTRVLEHLENELRDPTFPHGTPPTPST